MNKIPTTGGSMPEKEPTKKLSVFVSCADSKIGFLPILLKKIPKRYSRYHEPFLGSGALFFKLQPDDARLADIRRAVVEPFKEVQRSGPMVLEELAKYKNTSSFYYGVVGKRDKDMTPLGRAARHLYMNKASVPGFDCEDVAGNFRSPYGNKVLLDYGDADLFLQAQQALSKPGVTVDHASFELVKEYADTGDFVYFDPPHLPQQSNGDLLPAQDWFSFRDYVVLADVCTAVSRKGAKFLLTCPDSPFTVELFKEWTISREPIVVSAPKKDGKWETYTKSELLVQNY